MHGQCGPRKFYRPQTHFNMEYEAGAPVSVTADAVENETHFILYVSAPGVNKEDFVVEIIENKLRIAGERKFENNETTKVKFTESRFGKFERLFLLPANVDASHIEAEYIDGVLSVSLPKVAPETTPISVK